MANKNPSNLSEKQRYGQISKIVILCIACCILMGVMLAMYKGIVPDALAKFEEKGYNIIAVDNKWKESGAYKGINVDIVSPKGIPIEVQFTTYNNSDLKNRMHRYYEIVRDSRTPATIQALAEKKMYELATLWEVPDRITEV